MQSKEKELIETRTFVQLFEDLKADPKLRVTLQRELMYHLQISPRNQYTNFPLLLPIF